MLSPSSCRCKKNIESLVRATCEREWRTICASEYTSARVMSPIEPRTMEPLKTRMSSGSDTSGEKLSLARSFQNASLRRGSNPTVENDSTCAMYYSPMMSENSPCAVKPTLVVELVIRNNRFYKPIISAYRYYLPNAATSPATG